MFYSLCAISMPSVFSFWKAEQRWLRDFFFFLLEQAAIWLLQPKSGVFFLSVSTLVSKALDWALSASECRKGLCIEAVG